MFTNASGGKSFFAGGAWVPLTPSCAVASEASRYNEIKRPLAAAKDTRKKPRRFNSCCVRIASPLLNLRRSALDRFANTRVRAATTDVAAHRLFDIFVCWFRGVFEERNGCHDLTTLTVATLHDVLLNPRVLHCAADGVLTDAFDGHDRTIADVRNRENARTCGYSADMDRARAASADATAEFRAGHFQIFTQHPQQRC